MGTPSEDTLRAVEQRADTEFAGRILQSGFAFIPFALALAFTTEVASRLPLVFVLHVTLSVFSYALRWYWVRHGWERYYAERPLFWRRGLFCFILTGTVGWSILVTMAAREFGFETWTGFMLMFYVVGYAAVSMTYLIAHFRFFFWQTIVVLVPLMVSIGFNWNQRAWMVNLALAIFMVFLIREASILASGYRAALQNARRLEEQAAVLEEARRGADTASELKSKFLITMSHQIRTPMNGILGLTRLALDTPLNSEQREYVEGAQTSAESLLGLLNGLLDFSRIEADQVEIRETRFDPRELLAGLELHFAPLARQKGLRFRIVGLDPATPHLLGDAMRIRQVLTNLISNAVKFTHSGSVWLDVRVKTPEQARTTVEFAVGDTGVGIPVDRMRCVFEPFSGAADTSLARQADGLGLGLAISKRLTEAMGGSLDVESAVGRGSLFRLTLTLGTALPDHSLPVAREDFSAELAGLSILVAEDNATNQKLICRLLEKSGCKPKSASTGAQAVEMASSSAFDLILMDIQMPEMDGLTATRRIRERETLKGRETPIIALTANALAGDQKLCLEAGMDAFLAKPIHPEQLYEAIAQVIRARKASTA